MADLQFLVPPKVPSLSTDPASASAGDIYFNTSTNKLRVYNGSTWDEWSSVSTPVSVANGGTGATTLTSNNVLLGNGTGAVQVVAPGTSGNVLTSNGTTWQSAAPSGSSARSFSYNLFPATLGSSVGGSGSLSIVNGGYATLDTGTTSGSYVVAVRTGNDNITSAWSANPSFACEARWLPNGTSAEGVVALGYINYGVSLTFTNAHIGFSYDITASATTYNCTNANGSTRTATSVSSFNGALLNSVMSSGTNVKFYAGATLIATHTTNLPTGDLSQQGFCTAAVSNKSSTSETYIMLHFASVSFTP